MTRWILDVARLGVFCSLVLFTANTVLGDDEDARTEKTFGLKITVENGELKVEQTGSHDLGDLPDQLGAHLQQAIEQLGNGDAKIRVNAKALMKDSEGKLKELPIEEIIKAFGGELTIDSDIDLGEMDVKVDVQNRDDKRKVIIHNVIGDTDVDLDEMGVDVDVQVEEKDGKREVTIRKIIRDDANAIVLERIGDLKANIRAAQGQPMTWTFKGEDGDNDFRALMLHEGNVALPAATHRLGIAIGGSAGVVVADVANDSAAEAAGLEAGDIIIGVDGDTIAGIGALITKVNQAGQNDDAMHLRVVRGDKLLVVTAEPRQIEDDEEDDDEDEDEDEDEEEEHHGHDDHEHGDHEHGDEHAAREHGDFTRELHERARAMAAEAHAQARRHVESAHRQVEREMRRMSRELDERTRKMHQRGAEEMDSLREQIDELRDLVRELSEEVKQRD